MKDVRGALKVASVALLVGALVASCSDSDPAAEPTTAPSTDPASAAPTEDPTEEPTEDPTTEAPPAEPAAPTPTDGVLDLSDPAAGIIFTNLPDVTGPEAAAMNSWIQFETLYWSAVTTNTMPAGVAAVASFGEFGNLQKRVNEQIAEDMTLGGTVYLSPRIDHIDDDFAMISACFNEAEATRNFPDRVEVFDPTVNHTYRVQAELSQSEGYWGVVGYSAIQEECSTDPLA